MSHLQTASHQPHLQPKHFIGTISEYGASMPHTIEPYNTRGAYKEGNIVWVKTQMGGVQTRVTQGNSPHSTQIDGI